MKDHEAGKLHIETELSRDLGLPSALAIGVGTMIAAGIFTLSGLAINNVGSAAIVAFLLAAVVALFTALSYCEFVSIYPESGEGYLYARKTFRPLLAYFVGWALFLGYTSSCGFYIACFSTYFCEFVYHTPHDAMSGAICLIGLTLLNIKGTKESGQFQIVVTAAKVLLLGWFILGGIGSVDIEVLAKRFTYDLVKIGDTSAMVFITFFGFSAIAASAGEVRNPTKTIPRAIFLSMGIVTILYTLVVLVIIAAGLTEYDEAAMGSAAQIFLGPIGGAVIVGGALFSMISASNASIMAGSRVMLSMSRAGDFPVGFGAVNPRTHTPIVSLVIVGGTILIFTLGLSLEDLTHFADTVLLLALILVNAALIAHRWKFPTMVRPFRVPLSPIVPGLGILANLYLLSLIFSHHAFPMMLAGSSLVLGVVAYLAWQGFLTTDVQLPGAPSRVALERTASGGEHRFRVLVPLANPDNAAQLIDIAAAIASERQGEIVALRVAIVPEQLPPSREDPYVEAQRHVLELAHAAAMSYDIPITTLVRVGHDAARAILETAAERDCDLIVMGWKGYSSTTEKILGEVVDVVVNHARTDIILVKQTTHQPLRRFLLPTAGGEHARCAEQYVASLVRARDGALAVCSIASVDADARELAQVEQRLQEASDRIQEEGAFPVEQRMIRHKSVPSAVIETAAEYDAVVIGATRQSVYPQILFGPIPETVAKGCNQPVLLVKHYHPVKALFGRVMGDDDKAADK
ncbi:amino acid permease [Lignipirellula cremea]|uniref:Putative amino acid permease YhdG n=1 Tax=Lignipirellula cremea TaxID=2528010 RepID=A0A518E570_9BACT|nr:amino acid permease [Lignipirellula cremea]QDU99245.1 putative amino acid permease YhdG [Lignipirellula cremea]